MKPEINPKTIIVDSDALIALLNKDDKHAQTATSLLKKLIEHKARLIYPATTIVETTTTFQRKLNRPDLAAEIIQLIETNNFSIEPVDAKLIQKATLLFKPHGSKQNTLFDAIVAAIAQKYQTPYIFSFDHWYPKLGLQLIETLYQ